MKCSRDWQHLRLNTTVNWTSIQMWLPSETQALPVPLVSMHVINCNGHFMQRLLPLEVTDFR